MFRDFDSIQSVREKSASVAAANLGLLVDAWLYPCNVGAQVTEVKIQVFEHLFPRLVLI